MKFKLRDNIGIFFVVLSLIIPNIFAFLILFTISNGNMGETINEIKLLPPLEVPHLLITLIIYFLAFRKDIKNINGSGFPRTMMASIILAAVYIIVVALTIYGIVEIDPFFVLTLFIIVLPIGLFLSATMLSAFLSIIIWRRSLHIKAWGKDTVLILTAAVFLFGIPSLLFILTTYFATYGLKAPP